MKYIFDNDNSPYQWCLIFFIGIRPWKLKLKLKLYKCEILQLRILNLNLVYHLYSLVLEDSLQFKVLLYILDLLICLSDCRYIMITEYELDTKYILWIINAYYIWKKGLEVVFVYVKSKSKKKKKTTLWSTDGINLGHI